jgi:hypothetical protein
MLLFVLYVLFFNLYLRVYVYYSIHHQGKASVQSEVDVEGVEGMRDVDTL